MVRHQQHLAAQAWPWRATSAASCAASMSPVSSRLRPPRPCTRSTQLSALGQVSA